MAGVRTHCPLLVLLLVCVACTTASPLPEPPSSADGGAPDASVPCYSDDECGAGTCLKRRAPPPVFQWDDAEDLTWAPADVIAGYATLYNNHVDLRVRFRDTPFDPARSQTLRVCLDTDADTSTGTACGTGALAGADTAFTVQDGALVERGPIDDPCITNNYDAALRTIQFHLERDTFPTGYLEQQFRYVILSSFVNDAGEEVTDTIPDDADFSRVEGAFKSESSFTLWSSAGRCCRFGAGTCIGGTCQAE
jgi:hypothetical protein